MKTPDISRQDPNVRDGLAIGQTTMSVFVQELYYLGIVDISDGKDKARIAKNETPLSIGPASAIRDNLSPEFYFRLPPKVIEMSEPFATNITMTQNGGKFIESQGSPMKTIRLSGTTGFRPHRNDNKTLKLFGIDTGASGPIAQSVSLAGLGNSPDLLGTVASVGQVFSKASPWPTSEALGVDDAMFLKNMFRLYAWFKENAPNAASIIMIWRNIKDADYWMVEPTEFKLSQNSSSPLTYEWSIDLRTIAPFDYRVQLSKDPLQFSKDVSTFVARVNQSTAVIKQSFLFVANQIDRFSRLPYNFATFILGPMVSTIQGGLAVQQANGRFTSLFRASVVQLNTNLATYLAQAEDLFPVQSALINALRKAKRETERLLADPSMKESSPGSDAAEKKQTITNTYNKNNLPSTIATGSSGGSSFIGNQKLTTNVGQATINVGDDIRALAGRLLGDRAQYHTLVVLNKLSAPYIAPTRRKGVLQPGDTILYPLQTPTSSNTAISPADGTPGDRVTSADPINNSIDSQQQYKRDVRLFKSEESAGFETKYDIGPSQTGDVATVDGLANLAQAVQIKFSITRNELPAHPTFGALARAGSKATTSNLAGFRLDVQQTLLSDSRIAEIKALTFTAIQDVLITNATVVPIGTSSSLNLTLPLRRI